MRTLKYLALTGMLTMILPVASMASAKTAKEQKKNIAIADQVQLGGKTLAPGRYQLEWRDNGPTTNVKFIKNGRMVVTAPARVAQLQQKAPYDAVVENTQKNGTKTVNEIEWNNQREALRFGPQTVTAHHSHKRAS